MLRLAARTVRSEKLCLTSRVGFKRGSGRRFISCGKKEYVDEEIDDGALALFADMSEREKSEVKVLLHSCCAPCSGAMIEELQEQGLAVTVYFYNPNIHPRKEYDIRKNENIRFAAKLGIPIVDADYDVEEWYRRARGMEC